MIEALIGVHKVACDDATILLTQDQVGRLFGALFFCVVIAGLILIIETAMPGGGAR